MSLKPQNEVVLENGVYRASRYKEVKEWAEKFIGKFEEGFFSRKHIWASCSSPEVHFCCGFKEMEVGSAGDLPHKYISTVLHNQGTTIGLLATTSENQEQQKQALLDIGFKVIIDDSINPNSGNRVSVLVYEYPKFQYLEDEHCRDDNEEDHDW